MSNDFKLIDLTTVRTKLTDYIQRTTIQNTVLKQVIETLIGYEGKPITAHIANKLAKHYPSLQFRITSPYSWYSLIITGEGFDAIDLQLAYTSEPKVINVKRITDLNQRYLLDEERLVQYKIELDTIDAKCKAYNEALLDLYTAEAALDPIKFVVTENNRITLRDISGRPFR